MKEDISISKESKEFIQPSGHRSNLLEDFAYITSHNLRGPVSNLETLLYLWEHQNSEDIREDLFEKAKSVIQQLSETLMHLQRELQIRDTKQILYETINLNEIAEYAVRQNSTLINDHQANVTFDFNNDIYLYSSKIYIENIFTELLSNSLKFRHRHHKPIIFFQVIRNTDSIRILCSDNGSGIDLKRNGSHLFKFQRTFHNHATGKGVGLYIMKAQVESMGGTIEVSSEMNKGSMFCISLPECHE